MSKCKSRGEVVVGTLSGVFSNVFSCSLNFSLSMMEKLPGSKMYDDFAYDTALLQYFVSPDKGRRTQTGSSTARAMRLSGGSLRGGSLRGGSMRGSFRNKARASIFARSGSFNGGKTSRSDSGSGNSNSRGKRASVF